MSKSTILDSLKAYRKYLNGDSRDIEVVEIKETKQKHQNIFAKKTWQEYDFQKDIENDPSLQEVKPVGREIKK